MNAVEIEQAIFELAEIEYNSLEFPFQFLVAFGNKETTIKKLRKGDNNKSDIPNGILQRNNIHIATCEVGKVARTLNSLKSSPANAKGKVKFILATDGDELQAEDLTSGETIACNYAKFPNHFGFFLPLAGISTVKQIRDNPIDIQATSRLNRLYVELLRINEDWATAERRHDMNQFMGRLIFCYFAEDTNILNGNNLFTKTVEQMSHSKTDNTDYVLKELFRAMDTPFNDRNLSDIPRWADTMPYVNGGLFAGTRDVPKFTRAARSYLLHAGNLNWKEINPDIFGSMIQAVAEDEERGALGMHYTSVPNILKVLNPLFLDQLRDQLDEAGNNSRKLLNLKKKITRIRVFDPACGSGNFLVIAYKEMRKIEYKINERRNETHLKSEIPLKNFRGIELREFPAEIARLALIIAEFQCDVFYRGQKDALRDFLPLESKNWIVCGNALRLDWLSICPPTGNIVKHKAEDLFFTPLNQKEIDFENEGGETFICGNPPYIGTKNQSKENKEELKRLLSDLSVKSGNADYVFGWLKKAAHFIPIESNILFAFVTTNSIFEGEQAEILLSLLNKYDLDICHAHTSFKWSNNAARNAGVSCSICVISSRPLKRNPKITDGINLRSVNNIGPYLVQMPRLAVSKQNKPISQVGEMSYGSMSNDSNYFTLNPNRYYEAIKKNPLNRNLLKNAVGGAEFVRGLIRRTIYVPPEYKLDEDQKSYFADIFSAVQEYRGASKREATVRLSKKPHLYAEPRHIEGQHIFIPQILSEQRYYITAGILNKNQIAIAPHMQIINGELKELSLILSRIHLVWISTVCGKLETRFRYSNTLGWNTFPLPKLTEKNKEDLTRCSEKILLARESHFPSTIADLYDPEKMPQNLREAHDRNDEVIERIYIGRRFKNDTERLEKLFELYTKMISAPNLNERVS